MSGSAILDPTVLIDGLVPTIDSLRDLRRTFGAAAYRLYTVIRTWDGATAGLGNFVDVATEITPRPVVMPFTKVRNQLEPCGLSEAGVVMVQEVSLTYTHPELTGKNAGLAETQQFLLKIGEGYGQQQPDSYWVHDRPPYADREKTIGWTLRLRRRRDGA